MIPLELTVTGSFAGIQQAQRILSAALRAALEALGPSLQTSIRSRTRYFKGQERRSVKWVVRGRGLDLTLMVYSELVQAIVDELGLAPGTFPPHRSGSLLYKWAAAKALDRVEERREMYGYRKHRKPQAVSHLRSRASNRKALQSTRPKRRRGRRQIAPVSEQRPQTRRKVGRSRERRIEQASFLIARAIYERGIKPTMPFSKGLAANRNRVIRTIQDAVIRAVAQINRGG